MKEKEKNKLENELIKKKKNERKRGIIKLKNI
jgi:hypothetical protein